MDSQHISIKVNIKPILKIQNPSDEFLFEAEMEKIVIINAGTMIKNVCSEIMSKFGLDHLTPNSQAYIQFPGPKYFTFESFFPNLEVNVGVVKSLFGDALTVKISSIGDAKDFSEFDLKKTTCSNLFQLLLKKYPCIKEHIANPVINDIIESFKPTSDVRISYQTLFHINELIKKELNSVENNENNPSFIFVNNDIKIEQPPSPISITGDLTCPEEIREPGSPSQSVTRRPLLIEDNETLIKTILQNIPQQQNLMRNIFRPPTRQHCYSRCRVSFDPIKETPLLERWYETTKTPTFFQLQQYANHLNELSSRTTNAKITNHNVKIWFKNRRAKDNRVSKILEKKK